MPQHAPSRTPARTAATRPLLLQPRPGRQRLLARGIAGRAHTRARNPPCRTACPTTAAPRRSCSSAARPPARRDARDGSAARSAAARPAVRTTAAHWRATGTPGTAASAPAAGTASAARRSAARCTPNQTKAIRSSSTWLRSSDQNVICRCAWCSECSAHHQRN